MNTQLRHQYLGDFHPHITSAIPAAALIEVTTSHYCLIEERTQFYMDTHSGEALFLQNLFPLHAHPFTVKSHDQTKIELSCNTESYLWKATTPLYISFDADIIPSINHSIEIRIFTQQGSLSYPASCQFVAIPESLNPYSLIELYCCHSLYFRLIEIRPLQDIALTSANKMSIYLDTTANTKQANTTLHINTTPVFNYFLSQSEPFQIDRDKLIYQVEAHPRIHQPQLTLCHHNNQFFLSPDDAYRHHHKILSLPIQCYQRELHKEHIDNQLYFYKQQPDFMISIGLVSHFTAPILPSLSEQSTWLVPLLNFDYLLAQDYLAQLRSFLIIHNRNNSDSIDQLIDTIDDVRLNPTGVNCLNYHIQFTQPHTLQASFIHVLKAFFNKHRPINTSVAVSYDFN